MEGETTQCCVGTPVRRGSHSTLKVVSQWCTGIGGGISTEFLESLVSSDALNTVSHDLEHVDYQYQVESDP